MSAIMASQYCVRRLHRLVLTVVMSCSPFSFVPNGTAQMEDAVVVRTTAGDSVVKRRGTIMEWKGNSLTLSTAQREREIPEEQIIEIQTRWPASYRAALEMVSTGQFQPALDQLTRALNEESRPWAKRMIRSEQVRVLLALEQIDSAVDQFIAIIAEDTQSRFFYLCPLKWIGTTSMSVAKASALLKSRNPIEQLIGASWSIPGRDFDEATRTLEKLTQDLDPRVQKLAATQLWRVRGLNLSSVNDRQLEVWEQKIEELPPRFRAGPWYFLAEVQMKRKQFEPAKINWLRVPILYPEHYDLAAAALYQTSLLLDNEQQVEEANSLRNELRQKFGQSKWGRQLSADSGEN